MSNKLVIGFTAAAAVVLLSFSARAVLGTNSANGRRVPSQPRLRIEAAIKNGVMPSVDDLPSTQRAALAEQSRWASKMPRASRARDGRVQPFAATGVAGQSWVNVGPTDAAYQFNQVGYFGVDSGRPTAIVVDPRDPNVVYDAVSGGGVWKTYNFVTAYPNPTWIPVGDTLPNLAVGALAIDPKAPDTIYVGTGDSFDVPGNQIFKSTDGGATWSAPVTLVSAFPAAGAAIPVAAIRDIRVDPESSMNVLVASDQGLFRSTDAGATFTLVDLPQSFGNYTPPAGPPTPPAAPADTVEATWSLAYLGNHQWLVAGVSACDATKKGPRAGFGRVPAYQPGGTPACTFGNQGDIWRSADGGATWTSLVGTASALPSPNLGRMTIAVGPTTDPTKTVAYAFVENEDEWNNSMTVGVYRSADAGKTWVDASSGSTVANPTQTIVFQGQPFSDCVDLNVGHNQSWYNQDILVDPTNADNVIIGGNLCGVRTLNGTAANPTWENVSHWLPTDGQGQTDFGILPYVHADWHAGATFVLNGVVHAILGTDGGVFSASTLWDAKTRPEKVDWANHNRGLANHLMYTIASGDPAFGDQAIVYSGLQDNGTRYRPDVNRPTMFDQVVGGDGIGAAINHGTSGNFYWASSEFNYDLCVAGNGVDCSVPGNWNANAPAVTIPPQPEPHLYDHFDAAPFFVRYAPVYTDATGLGMLTISNSSVWLYGTFTDNRLAPPATATGWETTTVVPVAPATAPTTGSLIAPDFSKIAAPNGPDGVVNAIAHRKTANVFGAVLSGAVPAAVTKNAQSTAGNPAQTAPGFNRGNWIFAKNVTVGNTGTGHMLGAQTMDFPIVEPAGKQPGDTFILGFSGSKYSDGQPVPDAVARLFRTTDGGQTWQSLAGTTAGHQLPNVAVWVVKYDPMSAGVIYAGTIIGVYISRDDGATWDRFGDGLPMVSVRDIYVASNDDFVRIATYGRGVWEIRPSASANKGVDGDGDYDRNLQLDWVDLGAMGSRLGTSPATATQPLYTWIDDMTGAGATPPVAGIDDNDLSALLAGFGGHP